LSIRKLTVSSSFASLIGTSGCTSNLETFRRQDDFLFVVLTASPVDSFYGCLRVRVWSRGQLNYIVRDVIRRQYPPRFVVIKPSCFDINSTTFWRGRQMVHLLFWITYSGGITAERYELLIGLSEDIVTETKLVRWGLDSLSIYFAVRPNCRKNRFIERVR
jgi:hypothetical protein